VKVLGEVGVRKERDWSRRGKDGRSKKELTFSRISSGPCVDHQSFWRVAGSNWKRFQA